MKLIFAQGNPGTTYKSSRHNIGFLALDALAEQHHATFTTKPKFQAEIAEFSFEGDKVLLVKPTTFYNETGQSARLLVDFYKAEPATDVLVIHDDLALPFGTLRIREKGSDAGNNGIKSLNAHLGPDYHRIRVGVFNELRERVDDVNFVLGNFSKSEMDGLQKEIIPKIIELSDSFYRGHLQTTSHKLETNKKPLQKGL